MVTGHDALIDAMPNHPKDRHVVAAAVQAGARLIVTSNLKDFRTLPEQMAAQSPDEFLCNLFELAPERMSTLVQRAASALRNPPRTFADMLRGLAKLVPDFAACVAQHSGVAL